MNRKVWRFGDAEFDEPRGKLTVSGKTVDLDRNCGAILAVLLRDAGQEVPKECLLEAGWPDRIVHENSLAKAIGRLRVALGPWGAALRTVYGRGYRLEVDVRPEPASNDVPAVPDREREPGGGGPRVMLRGVAVAGLVGIAASIAWLALPASEPEQFRETPPIIGDAPDSIGRILWVDDHPSNNSYEKRFFEEHRISVHEAITSEDALRLLAMYDYHVLISDMGRGDDRLAGLKLTEQLRRRGNATPVVIYTVRPKREDQQDAQRRLVADAGAQDLALTPQEVRAIILRRLGNPPRRTPD